MTTPTRPRQFTAAERSKLFPLDFECVLDRNGKPVVTVRPSWEHQNLVRMGPYENIHLKWSPRVHILAAPVFRELFEHAKPCAWNYIQTFDGGYVPRLKRGVTLPAAGSPKSAYEKLLSNHSRGCAIDLNARWNGMGHPYDVAKNKGVGDLSFITAIADTIRVKQDDGSEWGIVCGAHWRDASCDPMHFEVGVWA
jgi:hypothetical protein